MSAFDAVKNDKLRRQIEFLAECDKMKNIIRRNLLADGSRRETDAEHSWHLALTAMIMQEYAPKNIDMYKVIRLVTVHDLCEVYAGDTFAFDTAGNVNKHEREAAGLDKLLSMLDSEQGAEIRALWNEFEAMETPESLYANAVDRFHPLINNYLTGGFTWKEGNVPSDRVYARMEPVRTALPELWTAVEELLESAIEKGILKK